MSYLVRLAFVFAITLGLGFSATGYSFDERVEEIFASSYHDPKIYVRHECQHNAFRLLALLEKRGIDISDSAAAFIWKPFGLWTNRARSFNEWTYHVVVIHKGFVLDLDFEDRPTILSLRDYTVANFAQASLTEQPAKALAQLETVRTRTIPATYYLANHPGPKAPRSMLSDFLAESAKVFPEQSLRDWVETKER